MKPSAVGVSDPGEQRQSHLSETYGIRTSGSNLEIAAFADIVVLAVKPQILPAVLTELRTDLDPNKLYISVAAGVTTKAITEGLGASVRVVRAMPNTPALVQAGATVIAAGQHASEEDMALGRSIFDAVGITEVLAESQLDAVTGLSGSGPAYVFVLLESLADAGVKVGIPRPIALRLAAQTVMGSAKLLLDTNGHPGMLKDMVTSPGGTTIAGVHALEKGGYRTTIISAVEAATNRAKELGKPA
jgi:pyrroline-5-carboxylate reductase